jgi:hypothetical protein
MKLWKPFAVNFLLCSALILGLQDTFTTSPKTFAQAYGSRDEVPIRVTTTVLSQRYCKEPGSDVSTNLRMRLRLRYTNVGTQPLILYKHENTVFREMISRDPSAAAARKYVWDFSLTVVNEGKNAIVDTSVPSSSFIVLRPAQVFDAEAEVTIFVRGGAGVGNDSDGLLPGDYILQVSVSTWPDSEPLGKLLRTRWQNIGLLWFHDLTSEPMLFRIEKKQELEKCSAKD